MTSGVTNDLGTVFKFGLTQTGITENSILNNFAAIYPNPNKGIFTIKTSILPTKLIIYDITGKKIITKTLSEMETTINISEFSNGVYFSSLSNDKTSMTSKLIISK